MQATARGARQWRRGGADARSCQCLNAAAVYCEAGAHAFACAPAARTHGRRWSALLAAGRTHGQEVKNHERPALPKPGRCGHC